MSKKIRWTVLVVLVMVVAWGLPQAAEACTTYRCQLIEHPTNPFCIACVDTGQPTGANCASSGPCGCYFIQCAMAVQAEVPSPLDGILTEEPTACSSEEDAQVTVPDPTPAIVEPTQAAA
jgi:hypothetical protein